jgi:hypothetical protein
MMGKKLFVEMDSSRKFLNNRLFCHLFLQMNWLSMGGEGYFFVDLLNEMNSSG